MRLAALISISMVPALVLTAAGSGSADPAAGRSADPSFPREEPFVARPFHPTSGDGWIGNGIAYGPHRDGQRPGGPEPNEAQLREDLHLISKYWNLVRLYGASGPAEAILEIIREDSLDMKVMLGVWIDAEQEQDENGPIQDAFPATREANRREVASGIHLANAYPELVLAVCVGNETQVFWSSHRVPPELLIRYVREVRARTSVPVAVADDFNFWNKPSSRALAREIDLLVMHAHPMWNGLRLAEAVNWTRSVVTDIRSKHPDRTIVLGETGWATRKHGEGEQATLIKGRPGEEEQRIFYDSLRTWVEAEYVPTFFFEAFDENWKGGDHPDEVEKHWGLFRADRTPKKAMTRGS